MEIKVAAKAPAAVAAARRLAAALAAAGAADLAAMLMIAAEDDSLKWLMYFHAAAIAALVESKRIPAKAAVTSAAYAVLYLYQVLRGRHHLGRCCHLPASLAPLASSLAG